jgi:hypothetical protein
VLKAAPKAPVTLDILDAAGTLVRHYSSDVAPAKIDLGRWEIAPEWTNIPVLLSTAPGMHRFVWPLRYAAPAALAQENPYADGVWAAPGRYTVALTVDGQRLTQPLTVRPDPRVKLAEDAYARQLALALKIEPLRVRAATAAHEAEKLLEALAPRGKGADAASARDIDAFSERVHALLGGKPTANPKNVWSFPPQRVQTLRYVVEALDALNRAVDGADAAPSTDAVQGLARLQPLIDATLTAWQTLQTRELAALNARLKAAGREPVEPKHD